MRYEWSYGDSQEANNSETCRAIASDERLMRDYEASIAAMDAARVEEARKKSVATEDFDNTVWAQRARDRERPKRWWQFI